MDFKFDDSGFKKIKKEIKKKVPIKKLFNPMFMKSFTKSRNFEEFKLKSGFTLQAFKLIPNKDLDKYICVKILHFLQRTSPWAMP